MIRVSARSRLRCAYCHAEASGAVACAGCRTLVHPACSKEAGRCPTLGCDESPAAPVESKADAASWFLSGWVAEAVCLFVIVLAMLFVAGVRKFNSSEPSGPYLRGGRDSDLRITDKIR